jgi:hypothetical protein
MRTSSTFKEQVQRNMVALISLAVAVTGLGYNTWRNEVSEHNRNQRLVSIELLLMLGDLEQLTLDKHYGAHADREAVSRKAWAKVLSIRDLAQISEGSVPESAMALYDVWSSDYDELGDSTGAKDRIVSALGEVRGDAHEVLKSLD